MTKIRPYDPVENLSIGKIYEVDGTQIRIELDANLDELTTVYEGEVYSIGQFGSIIQIPIGRNVVFAMVTRLTMKNEIIEGNQTPQAKDDSRVIIADLFGEGKWKKTDGNGEWRLKFERGVSKYPLPLQTAYVTQKSTLAHIYGKKQDKRIDLGDYVGSGSVPCFADVSTLIGKHTAILGSTGSGKSATTASIIHSILKPKDKPEKWSPQIIILDPHGEYKKAFPDAVVLSTDDGSLSLPYWLLNSQETAYLLTGKTESAATAQTKIIREALASLRTKALPQATLDSPVPYKISELKECIKSKPTSSTSEKNAQNSIVNKIDALRDDARLKFLMDDCQDEAISNPVTALNEVISPILQIKDAPIIIDFSGIPDEVSGICSSAIAKLLFNSKIWQTPEERANNPILLVCEEAHRYVPNQGDAQYGDVQEEIQRIAKEGRKYGIGLFLVSQRPSEVDQTVLSQCSSWIVLRLTNEEDRSKVASILPDSLSGLTKMLSGLRDREAIFAGLASDVPARIRISKLEEDQVPASNDIDFIAGWSEGTVSDDDLKDIIKRWQHQSMNPEDESQGS